MTLICSFKLAQLTCLLNVGHKLQPNLRNNFMTYQQLQDDLWKCWVLSVSPRTCSSIIQEFSEISSSWVWENYTVWNDCWWLPSFWKLPLALHACWAHLCTFSMMVESVLGGFYPPLDGLKSRFCRFPFYSLPVDPSLLAITPFPSRIAKNIRGQMVGPCSRVLAFHLTVSNHKIWSPFPQILAFSPEWLRVVKFRELRDSKGDYNRVRGLL